MTILHSLRQLARRCGIDVSRYPEATAEHQAARLLVRRGIDLVLDVGANDGGYAAALRRAGYRDRIVSFEPVRQPFRLLRARTADDPRWTALPVAVGDGDGSVDIHVAGNAAASSSVLRMLPLHAQAAPESQYVATETVEQHRLDTLWNELVPDGSRVFLKVDVQGAEKHVLAGAGDRLARCAGVQLEVSFAPLYEGGMLYREALDCLESAGLSPMYVVPGFTDPRTGRMYQCDVVCFRE
jgi:FkbM family methyltransferase